MKKAAFQHTSPSSGESAVGFGLLDPFVTAAVLKSGAIPEMDPPRKLFSKRAVDFQRE
jgi:hypothetical protein